MTPDAILKILDDMANREAMTAEECSRHEKKVAALLHQCHANGIGMAAKEIRRRMKEEADAIAAADKAKELLP